MRRERFLRFSVLASLTFVVLTFSVSSKVLFGQSGPVSGACNQPLASPVTHFDIADGHPVAPVSTRDGCWIFVTAYGNGDAQGVVVLRRTATGIERVGFVRLSDRPRLVTLTPDDKTLVVGTGRNVALLDVVRLIGGKSDPVIGYVGDGRFGNGINNVAVTADGKYLFVIQATTAWISIIDLEKARVSPDPAAIIGGMPVAGMGGLSLSPDGRYLYATQGTLNDVSLIPGAKDWPLTCGDRDGSPDSPRQREGALVVIDVQRAIAGGSSAIVSAVRAGCWPGFHTISPDGNTIYVTAMADKAVLAFDIRSRQAPSFIGKAPVGPAAVGIRTIHGGTKIVVANSDQFQHPNEPQTLTILDAAKMTGGGSAVLGAIPSGPTPRHMHVTSDGRTLLVANDGSSTLQIVDLDRLALAMKPAQQASSSNACNQPAADPITDFKVDGIPRFALPSQDGCWVFLRVDGFTENRTRTSGVAVLARDSGALRLVRYFSIPGVHDTMAFTPNQKMLIVKADRRIAVLDVEALKSGIGTPVRGYINDIHFTNTGGPQTGQMPVSRDGKYLFVSQHSLAWISIIDLQKVEAGIFGAEAVAGGFPTEIFPSGITISPDDKYLLINTGGAPPALDPTPRCRDSNSTSATDPLVAPKSALSVIDIGKAFSSPASSLVSAASTGCSTAPHATSPDGKTLYTVAHRDNNLLALDIRPSMDGGKAPILIGSVPVGSLPRDLIVVDGGKKVIVANSNQLFGTATDTETLTVIDTAQIASGAEAVLGTIRVGADPRYLSVTHDGRTIFVSNLKAQTLQMIDLERLPLQPVKP